jgi:hypothetical protein
MKKSVQEKTMKPLLIILCGLCLGLLAAGYFASGIMFAAPAEVPIAGPDIATPDQCVQLGGSIQAAIDAAPDDGLVALEKGYFSTTLFIAKSLTLSGGWSTDCSTHYSSTTDIAASGPGRVITIKPLSDGVHVRLEQLSITGGDASGLGGAAPLEAFSQAATTGVYGAAGTPPKSGPPVLSANWRETLRSVYQRGLFPGSAAEYAALLERVDRASDPNSWLNRQLSLPVFSLQPAPAGPIEPEVDCGGGIYLNNASLELADVLLGANVASKTGAGYGGALCAVNLAPAGVVLDNSQANDNIASLTGAGAGGAIYIEGANRGQVHLGKDVYLGWDIASLAGVGRGGALAVTKSPTVTLQGVIFERNLAGRPTITNLGDTQESLGGAVYLDHCPNAVISGGTIFRFNTAASGGEKGFGGGLAAVDSPGLQVLDETIFHENTANVSDGKTGISGFGGGLAVIDSPDTQLDQAIFEYNSAAFSGVGFGGGFYGLRANNTRLQNNTFRGNMTVSFSGGNHFGGGADFISTDNITITKNTFYGNAVGVINPDLVEGMGPSGGGLSVDSTKNVLVEGNTFEANTGMVSGIGMGAALSVVGMNDHIVIRSNDFIRNISVRAPSEMFQTFGTGAGVLIEGANDVSIQHNLFLDNAGNASGKTEESSAVITSSGTRDDILINTNISIDSNRILNSGLNLIAGEVFKTGGIFSFGTEYLTITNNILANNSLDGILVNYAAVAHSQYAYATIVNNTLVNNQEFGIGLDQWPKDNLTVSNNILVGHNTAIVANNETISVTVDHNLFYSNTNNLEGMIENVAPVYGNPQFVNPSNGDYHLWFYSPAIDAGRGVSPAPPLDFDGITRPFGPAVDIGAFEWHQFLFKLPVILLNWLP